KKPFKNFERFICYSLFSGLVVSSYDTRSLAPVFFDVLSPQLQHGRTADQGSRGLFPQHECVRGSRSDTPCNKIGELGGSTTNSCIGLLGLPCQGSMESVQIFSTRIDGFDISIDNPRQTPQDVTLINYK